MRTHLTLAVLLGLAPPAHADTVGEIVDQARRLDDTIDLLVAVGYALQNPEELQHLPATIYGELRDEIARDPIMRPLFDSIAAQYRNGVVRVSVDAGIAADRATPIAATAAVDAAWELPLCKVIGANAYGLAGYDGEALAAYAFTGTACLPLPANTIQVSYTRRDNVRTTLLTRPVVLRDRRRNDIVDVMIRFYRYLSPSTVVDVMPLDIHVDVSRSAETVGFGAQDYLVQASPAHWTRRGKGFLGGDQRFEFFQLRAWGRDDEDSTRAAQNVVIIPLGIDGIRLGEDAAMGAEVGWAQAAGYDDITLEVPPKAVARTDVHARAWLDVAIRPVVARLELSHTILPTFDAQLVLEDRVQLRGQSAWSRYVARAEAFVSRARLLREGGELRAGLAGGALDLSLAAFDGIHVVGRVEGARALDAVASDQDVALRWELRATLGVTAHFDRSW